jgi:hypothetical protein
MIRTSGPDCDLVLDLWLDAGTLFDGQHNNFTVGQTAEFAVEYWLLSSPQPILSPRRHLSQVEGGAYDVWGCRLPVRPEDQMLNLMDVGLIAYHQDVERDWLRTVSPGSWFTARANLNVASVEFSNTEPGPDKATAFIYSWRIEHIRLETTPWIETVHASGQTVKMRDRNRRSYRDLDRTDARRDGALATYVLRCRMLDTPPQSPVFYQPKR